MTQKPLDTTISNSNRIQWLKYTPWILGLACAFLTTDILQIIVKSHGWGPEGIPAWASNIKRLSIYMFSTQILIFMACFAWSNQWFKLSQSLTRDGYQKYYRWSLIVGFLGGMLFTPAISKWLASAHVPDAALSTFALGTIASVASASLAGFYRLEALSRTQRDLLMQAQLAPHFLFNSLSTLKGQIAEEPLEAQNTADRLSRIFRELMDMSSQPSLPLSRELAFVESYLGLEKARLGDRLKVQIHIPDELETVEVPPLCLQVLVENAIRHAIAPRPEGGLLSIRALRTPEGVQLTVTDPGNGTTQNPGTGRGIKVLQARLSKPSDLSFAKGPDGYEARVLVRNA